MKENLKYFLLAIPLAIIIFLGIHLLAKRNMDDSKFMELANKYIAHNVIETNNETSFETKNETSFETKFRTSLETIKESLKETINETFSHEAKESVFEDDSYVENDYIDEDEDEYVETDILDNYDEVDSQAGIVEDDINQSDFDAQEQEYTTYTYITIQEIPYTIIERAGSTNGIVQYGVNGEEEVVIEEIYLDGVLIDSVTINRNIITDPTPEIIEYIEEE